MKTKQISISDSLKKIVLTNRRFWLAVFLSFSFLLIAFQGINAQTDYNFINDSGLSKTGSEAGYTSNNPSEPEIIVGQIVQAVLSLLGVLFLGLMIFAGIIWLTAQGDDQKALRAKKILEESITGIIIVLLAYAITYFLINYFTTQNVINN